MDNKHNETLTKEDYPPAMKEAKMKFKLTEPELAVVSGGNGPTTLVLTCEFCGKTFETESSVRNPTCPHCDGMGRTDSKGDERVDMDESMADVDALMADVDGFDF